MTREQFDGYMDLVETSTAETIGSIILRVKSEVMTGPMSQVEMAILRKLKEKWDSFGSRPIAQ